MKVNQEISVLDYLYHSVSERVKLGFDIAAATTAISGFLGVWTNLMGAIGTTAAAIYGVVRLYYYIKDKRAGR